MVCYNYFMRYARFIFLLTLISILYIPDASASDSDEWYPFVLSENLSLDSPANIGKLILNAPAGKHGFVKVKDSHFYFEDGTRAKFWGTNLCFSACFPTKEQAESMANRLAFFGFNAVRLHHMDSYFEPRGIFEDTEPDAIDPQMKKTTKLSEKQLGRLDYLIFQLKERGIYVDINLLVSRHFTKADGVIDADKLGMAAKPGSMFDPKLIELQRQYAKNLLTHYNPYTKLKYCDDPVIALIEITNENSISLLKDKHTRSNFKTEKEYFDRMTNFLRKGLGIKVPITGIGGCQVPEDVYAQASCDFIDLHAYWDHPRFPRKQWDRDDFIIDNKSMLLDRALGIVGYVKKNRLDKNKPYTLTEWNHCYPNQYAYETPVLLASEALKNDWDGIFQFAFAHDLNDKDTFDNIERIFDIMTNPQQLILCSVGSLLFIEGTKTAGNIENGVLKLNSPYIKGAAGFIKGKSLSLGNLSITSDTDGAVFVYSGDNKPIIESNKLILVTISEIKNRGAGWKNDRFLWGTAPTLMKKMDVEIDLGVKRKFKVYELDQSGSRIKKDSAEYLHIFSTKDRNSSWFEISFD